MRCCEPPTPNQSLERQLQLAEDVRLARIRQLRSYRALIIPTFRRATERLKQFDAKIAALERIKAKQILEEFKTLEARHAKRLTKRWSEPPTGAEISK